MKRDERYARPAHKLWFFFLRRFFFLYTRLFLGFRCRDRYRIKKGEPVIVLSNHQTDEDPFCLFPVFDAPVYPVATDHIFSGKLRSRLFSYFSVIPKKKEASDAKTVLKMFRLLKGGASILLFPEGNRTYAEFCYPIAPGLPAFIKKTKATIVLFNIRGGTGVSPRFKNKKRRGPFTGEIRRVLPYAEYAGMEDGALSRLIADTLTVFDSESGARYKSRRRAEYLERMLFACPRCGQTETLFSEGAFLTCRSCGLRAEYGEDLRLHGLDGYERLVDWWNFQKNAVRKMEIPPNRPVFCDEGVTLFFSTPFEKRKRLARGKLALTGAALRCGGHAFETEKISAVSAVSGRNLTFRYGENDYTLRGGKRFNPVKYLFLLNRLGKRPQPNETEQSVYPGD